jgi:hypothetical protein
MVDVRFRRLRAVLLAGSFAAGLCGVGVLAGFDREIDGDLAARITGAADDTPATPSRIEAPRARMPSVASVRLTSVLFGAAAVAVVVFGLVPVGRVAPVPALVDPRTRVRRPSSRAPPG